MAAAADRAAHDRQVAAAAGAQPHGGGRGSPHGRPPDAWRTDYRSYGDAPIDYHARENERAEHYPDNRVHDRWHDDDPGHAGEADHYQLDDVPLEPHEDEMYDDAPRRRHHGGLVTALVLIGCAMLGTAGAYGFRSYYIHPNAAQPPPVITADSSTPTKIVPATVDASQSSTVGQDRSANGGREQLVSKQEEPVALRELGTQAAPRVVLPAPVVPAPAPAAAGSTEPKKVRTVTIRPDGADPSGRPVVAPPTAVQAPPAVGLEDVTNG